MGQSHKSFKNLLVSGDSDYRKEDDLEKREKTLRLLETMKPCEDSGEFQGFSATRGKLARVWLGMEKEDENEKFKCSF